MDFSTELSKEACEGIKSLAKKSRLDTLRMIWNAKSGHLGGGFSSMDIYAVLWACKSPLDEVVISHGHTSAAIYAVLGNLGYFDVEEAVRQFRKGGAFEGHPSPCLPQISWCSGVLGQGLSVGCGLALAKKLGGQSGRVFVVMGDGEQQKGQLQEAREFAYKYALDLVAIIDANNLQSSGSVQDVMPQDLSRKYQAAGWQAAEVDGHDVRQLFDTLKDLKGPSAVIARTVMAKGLPFIEDDFRYHGGMLTEEQYDKALRLLPIEKADLERIGRLKTIRKNEEARPAQRPGTGDRIVYPPDVLTDCRSAFGKAIADIAAQNRENCPVVLDCDLLSALKLDGFREARPDRLIECGIAEQNACTTAAALAQRGYTAVLATFAVFAVAECYSQQRAADINQAPIKVFCTHAGLDVGEDGKTHQSLDYLSLLGNLKHCRVMLAADPNQADLLTRYALSEPGATAVLMGRSKTPVLTDERGREFYGGARRFEYGQADWIRRGKDACIVTAGNMVSRAAEIAKHLAEENVSAGVLNITCPFALDEEKLREAAETGFVVVYEDHNVENGLGSLVASFYMQNRIPCSFYCRGAVQYGVSASPQENYERQGLDVAGMVRWMKQKWSDNKTLNYSQLRREDNV